MSETHRDRLHAICERLAKRALLIAGECKLTVTERGLMNPNVLAAALLCRTAENFKGVFILTERKMVVEARVLARCCYENMFMVGGLSTEGGAFVDRMIADDRMGRSKRLKLTEDVIELSEETQEAVQRAYEELSGHKKQFLKPQNASSIGPFADAYIAYAQLCGDAAHPTITALARHWSRDEDGKGVVFDLLPTPDEAKLEETLHLACIALLSTMVVVDQINGHAAGNELIALNTELKALQAERWGSEEIGGEGIEIRTKKPHP